MKKNILPLIFVFIGSFLGGLFLAFIAPNFVNTNHFFGQNGRDQTLIVNKTEEVYISENEVVEKIIEKNKNIIVNVRALKNNKLISSGLGFIVSSDGLVITRKEVVFSKNENIKISYNGKNYKARIIKEDELNGLVLLESDLSNTQVASFAMLDDIALGAKVFLIGEKKGIKDRINFVNFGVIKSIDGSLVETNIQENSKITGTPLIDLKGNVIGINFINSDNYVFSITSDTINNLIYK